MSRPSPRPAAYHLLSTAEKSAQSLSRMREPSVSCPACDMQVMPEDLLKHMDERCVGLRDPGGGAKWVTWAQVVELGRMHGKITSASLLRWVENGQVRRRGQRIDYQYLLRDLVMLIAVRKLRQRRDVRFRTSDDQNSEGMK